MTGTDNIRIGRFKNKSSSHIEEELLVLHSPSNVGKDATSINVEPGKCCSWVDLLIEVIGGNVGLSRCDK